MSQSGSQLVQKSGSDPVGSAIGGLGQAVFNIGIQRKASEDRREIERQKQEEALQKERQKIYDSSSKAYVQRKIKAAKSALDIAMAENPGNPNSWVNAHEDAWKQANDAFGEVSGNLSEESLNDLQDRLQGSMEEDSSGLNLAIVRHEGKAKNESWMLNAQLAADEEDWDGMEEAIDNVDWVNDAAKQEFRIKTKQTGQYNSFNRQMLAIEDPDELYKFEEDVLKVGQDSLNKSQRNTLAMQAKQRASRIQKTYNSTMRGLKSRMKRMDFPTVEEVNDLIASNQMDPEMVDSYYAMYDESAEKANYKQLYDTEVAQPTFMRKETDIVSSYLDEETAPKNVNLTRERKRELIADVDAMNIKSVWAKNDLYSLIFEAENESLREPDSRWFGIQDDPIGPEEREFRMAYNQKLKTYAKTGQLSQNFGKLFIANEEKIISSFEKGDVESDKLMDELTKLVVNSMMNENLKRQLGSETPE